MLRGTVTSSIARSKRKLDNNVRASSNLTSRELWHMTELWGEWHRRTGIPRWTWLHTVELDVRQCNISVRSAWQCVQYRGKWKKITETATLSEHGMLPALGPRRRRHCVVVEDCSVAPVWPRRMAARHRSAGGRSWRSWSIQRLQGRPELRTQSRSGRLPTDASTCSLSAWWAGMLGDILATCPKMALGPAYALVAKI